MTTDNITILPNDYTPERLPPNLPDLECEPGIATVPLAEEPHRPDWQPDIPERYLQMSPEELVARIEKARATLGSRLLILGHHYQRECLLAIV